MTSARRVRRHRARQKAAVSPPLVFGTASAAAPPGDDFVERQGAIKACDDLVEQLKAIAATLMPPTPEGEDSQARLWHRLGLERAVSIIERYREDVGAVT
jgi:hypothetical protein